MSQKNIVILGMMGAGKTRVSKRLAEILNRTLISTDQMIEESRQQKIAVIFKDKGENFFRHLEREAVKKLAECKEIVIDCGGGIVLNPENLKDFKKEGILIYLEASADVIWERVKHNRARPLLNVQSPQDKIKELLKEREPLYAQSDYRINTDHKTIEQIVQEIINLLSHE